MEITDAKINSYIEQYSSKPSHVLQKIERETYLRSIYPRMLSGHVQGRFISMISRMIKPQFILEIGTFTGYSAICLCEGLKKSGQLHTIEINEELQDANAENFKFAKVDHLITAHFGNAIDIIPKLGIQFDLIFIDADKVNYCSYFDLALHNLKVGGFILADNVLWSGKVLQDPRKRLDKDTQALMEFNKLVNREPSVENIMIPLRDGMTLIQKLE